MSYLKHVLSVDTQCEEPCSFPLSVVIMVVLNLKISLFSSGSILVLFMYYVSTVKGPPPPPPVNCNLT